MRWLKGQPKHTCANGHNTGYVGYTMQWISHAVAAAERLDKLEAAKKSCTGRAKSQELSREIKRVETALNEWLR
ncbi:MAG: hypothetical protein HY459_00285 [Parcubacteria group bacterium]|nr:hypothetical protein [Parcubacteria group bacterium]